MRQRFDISINDYNRELFTVYKTVLEQRDGESAVHVLLKILAASLYYDPGIRIEPSGVDPVFRPDLLVTATDGSPGLWIECGKVTTSKLDKLTSRYGDTKFVVVKRYPREVNDLYERVSKDVRRPHSLSYVAFDPGFVDQVARFISGSNQCIAIISDDQLQFIINGHIYGTDLYSVAHPPPAYRGKRAY